ncbi:hypothetical protein ACFE33_09295 [Falsihalocynthiibacter sp. SS001]|uniref:hypothetical protein n=1 Tax=Falsihalocynthiibacter sp. SS001 TaxID=3349698 RepID=UPI0036D2E79A
MFAKSTLSVLALSLAIPFAGAASAGGDQLAKSAGVEPGIYTTAELIQITEARRANDAQRLDYYLSGENRVSRAATDYTANAGVQQLAALAGVSPEGYTAGTLNELILAQRANDDEKVKFIKARAAGEISDLSPSSVSAGKAQLAALVGLDPSTNSYADLIIAAE